MYVYILLSLFFIKKILLILFVRVITVVYVGEKMLFDIYIFFVFFGKRNDFIKAKGSTAEKTITHKKKPLFRTLFAQNKYCLRGGEYKIQKPILPNDYRKPTYKVSEFFFS